MKIALLIDSLGAGGAERQLILLANGLAAREHEVHLILYHNKLQLIDDVDRTHVHITQMKRGKSISPLFFFRLVVTLRKINPDAIISFLPGPNFWARICGPFARPKTIITSVRNIDLEQSKIGVWAERILYRVGKTIVANTHACNSILQEVCNIPSEKLSVIYNGVDMQRFRRQPESSRINSRKAFDLHHEHFVIVLPGRLDLQKNHDCLIRAASRLGTHGTGVKILFAGNESDQNLKRSLIQRIDQLGLNDRFIFCGTIQDMASLYNMADLIVLPSKWEGLPNVVLEAMACEKPVIISDVSDNREIVQHGRSGYLFKSNDDAELARIISEVIESPDDLRKKVGAAARSRIDELFSAHAYIKNFERLLH